MSDRAFADPQSAVERINELLAAEDWATLAAYYDLSGSDLTEDEIGRWEWFDHGGRPVADPHGRSGPRHPFPKGARYRDHAVNGVVCRVTVELDPGLADLLEGPGPRGHDGPDAPAFFLIHHDEGWQLLDPNDERIG